MEYEEDDLTEIINGVEVLTHPPVYEQLDMGLCLTEIINGEVIVGPSPFGKHQDIVFNLADIMRRHVKTNNLGKVYLSPLDVILEEGINRVQPDILFIRKENMSIMQDWVRGIPDMVCEVVLPWSYGRDTGSKKAIYEKYRVPEYWIVLPELQNIVISTIENGKYVTYPSAAKTGVVTSKVIEGLQVNIKDIFED
ncbi:MAG: Uma2 family endonuclease [Nitrospirae bacterium]|nr:Uma2 family endonuclease [Nitrospirota bacterium]